MDKERTFTPIVISSRKAKKHIETVEARHAELLAGMNMQSEKRKQTQMQRMAEEQVKAQKEAEQKKMQQDKQAKDHQEIMAHVKDMMANNAKMKELEIKRIALQTHGE